MKGKGVMKRSKGYFKKGHPYYVQHATRNSTQKESAFNCDRSSVFQRLSSSEYESLVECSSGSRCNSVDPSNILVIRDEEGKAIAGRLLRKASSKPGNTETKDDILNGSKETKDWGYKLMHDELTRRLWNHAIKEHKNCDGELHWGTHQQWGLCWTMSLKCLDCEYKTKPTKLYEEPSNQAGRPGRKSAIPNLGLQVGLTHTPVSNNGFRTICTAIGIPPPNIRGLQKAANKVGKELAKLNIEDMGKIRQELHALNEIKGDQGIWAETDSLYNIPLQFGGDRVPGQPASQVITTISENTTPAKKVIGAYLGNKHCNTGQTIMSKGGQVNCPNHLGHCSQTLDVNAVIGDEQRNVSIAYRDILKSDLKISAITTDGDSKSAIAIESINKEIGVRNTKMLRDPGHLKKNHQKYIKRQEFSSEMFSAHLKVDKDRQKRDFARDIARRCNAEMAAAVQKFQRNAKDIKMHMKDTIEAIITCHGGNCCELCKKHSLVCTPSKKWQHTVEVTMTRKDKGLLRHCLEYRLGPDCIAKTDMGTSTQKSEAVNRAIRRSLAKNVLYKRNAVGRMHSAIHRLNNCIGVSLATQLKRVGADVTKCERMLIALKSLQSQVKYDQFRQKTIAYKQRRCYLRSMRHNIYNARNAEQSRAISYAKGLMDPMNMKAANLNIKTRHSYAKSLQNAQKKIKGDHAYS